MPRPVPILAALILAAGSAVAETGTKPAISAATPPPAASQKQVFGPLPGLSVTSVERQIGGKIGNAFYMGGSDVVARLFNASAEPAPKGSHGIELKCTSPSAPARTVRRLVKEVAAHGHLDVKIIENDQTGPDAPAQPPFPNIPFPSYGNPFVVGLPTTDQPEKLLDDGPAWACTVGLAAPRGRSGPPSKSISWGPEFDYGISGITFEDALSAPPTVNVKVAVLSKRIGNQMFVSPVGAVKRTLRLDCSKPGFPASMAEKPASGSVLFGAAGAGFLPAPAAGWTCKATLAGPGPDLDPSNDSWSLTAP